MVSNEEIRQRLEAEREGKIAEEMERPQKIESSKKEAIGPAKRIKLLKELLDKGIIGEEEFENKKSKIMSEI